MSIALQWSDCTHLSKLQNVRYQLLELVHSDPSTDFILAQEGSNEAYGSGEQLWLTCVGHGHHRRVSVEHLRRSNALYMGKCMESDMA